MTGVRLDSQVSVLMGALRQLDLLLDRAVAATKPSGEHETAAAFRGLYIAPEEASSLLGRPPGEPTFSAGRTESQPRLGLTADFPPLTRLAASTGLCSFDLDVMVVALAPELDLRYERLYAYLQDDVTRCRPSVD